MTSPGAAARQPVPTPAQGFWWSPALWLVANLHLPGYQVVLISALPFLAKSRLEGESYWEEMNKFQSALSQLLAGRQGSPVNFEDLLSFL